MKTLLITRKMPAKVVEAARARFDVTVREKTSPLTLRGDAGGAGLL